MQNVKSIDNQLVKCTVVQMWFKSFGNNFHVFGTKTDSKSLRYNLREDSVAQLQIYEIQLKSPNERALFSGQKKKVYKRILKSPSIHIC